ncbi:alpha/beta hydrolase family protein [Simiduia sp. 21SJ11W-1]|uniref:DUF3530 family protein n=1 Tax=Simiduia sp. 21SJ11W-1 TaxID=2909669 RepID=UPI00209EBF3E|nr:DUF3530 family protein [Simiduia sp. 21SJ11W-1]UTA48599.1 alpha/beta hydrolase family protein [Simiduia sp. 21SJ11W-1]
MRKHRWVIFGWLCLVGLAHGQAADENAAAPDEVDAALAPTAAAEPEPTPEPPLYASREARDMALLAQAVPSDQVVWFDIGGERVLGLYHAAISANPSGAVLLVQDQDRNPTWPERIQALRLSLPEQGWTTMVVTLPPADPAAIPERDLPPAPDEAAVSPAEGDGEARPETEEVFNDATGDVADVASMAQEQPAPTPTPEVPKIPAQTRVDQRLAQAIEHLRGQGQFNLALLAEGGGAVRAARLFAGMGSEGFRALVLVDARHNLGTEAGDVLAMASAQLPVLDVIAVDQPALLAAAKARHTAAKRAGREGFQQLSLPRYEPDLVRLSKRVRGFLDRHAKGVKVDNAQVIQNPPD